MKKIRYFLRYHISIADKPSKITVENVLHIEQFESEIKLCKYERSLSCVCVCVCKRVCVYACVRQ